MSLYGREKGFLKGMKRKRNKMLIKYFIIIFFIVVVNCI